MPCTCGSHHTGKQMYSCTHSFLCHRWSTLIQTTYTWLQNLPPRNLTWQRVTARSTVAVTNSVQHILLQQSFVVSFYTPVQHIRSVYPITFLRTQNFSSNSHFSNLSTLILYWHTNTSCTFIHLLLKVRMASFALSFISNATAYQNLPTYKGAIPPLQTQTNPPHFPNSHSPTSRTAFLHYAHD
jgi:hypothetical protein